MRSNLLVSALCFFMSIHAIAIENVKIVAGSSQYGLQERTRGIKPPTEVELVDLAKKIALEKLGNLEEFVQIVPVQIESTCEPLFQGSLNCIEGSARYKAAFVVKEAENSDWYLTTEGIVSSWIPSRGEDEARARVRAEREAKFACGSRSVSEVGNPKVWCNASEHPEDGWCKLHYRSLFKCAK